MRMPKRRSQRQSTRESLAKNLKYLLDKHELSYRAVSEKTGEAVSPKTVGNMVNAVGGSSIDNVEAVAQVFGLTGWQMILPGLIDDIENNTSIATVYESYFNTDAEGRKHIQRIAEREAEYSIDPPPPKAAS